jgi:hypothetical protein
LAISRQENMTIIWIASLIALALSAAGARTLWKLTRPHVPAQDSNAWLDSNWQAGSPMARLLDPSEFQFLRAQGVDRQLIRRFRAKRRSLFRMYIRQLKQDFNAAHSALEAVLVTGQIDRPDIVAELGRQRVLFYSAVIHVEFRLALNALGLDRVPLPSLQLIRPLESLHMAFCNLVPDMAAGQA